MQRSRAPLCRPRAALLALALALGAAAPLALTAVPAALAGDAFADAKKALDTALKARDAAKVKEAVAALGAEGSEKAARALVQAAPFARELEFYDELLAASRALSAEAAIQAFADEARKASDWTVRYFAVEALGGLDAGPARAAVIAAFEDKHDGVASCAIKLARSRKWKEAVSPLIDRVEKLEKKDADSRVLGDARRALEGITGQSFSSGGDWKRWWAENESRFGKADGGATAGGASREEQETAVTRVRERGEYDFIETLAKGDIFVVKGHSDECEAVLDALKIPYTLWDRAAAKSKLATLDPKSVLVFNCEGDPEENLKGDVAKALTAFVERGGYLFTSDWALNEELLPCFPGYLSMARTMPEGIIEVKIAPAKGLEKHPYLRDVFPESPFAAAKVRWKVDNSANTFKVTPKAASLVESSDLESKGGGTSSVVATFRHGKGAVLHVLGHFKLQMDDKAGDGLALQQLLVNFIVEKQKFRKQGGKKK